MRGEKVFSLLYPSLITSLTKFLKLTPLDISIHFLLNHLTVAKQVLFVEGSLGNMQMPL